MLFLQRITISTDAMIDKLKSAGAKFLEQEHVSADSLDGLPSDELSALYAKYEASVKDPDATRHEGNFIC